jgi:hypothetical protein
MRDNYILICLKCGRENITNHYIKCSCGSTNMLNKDLYENILRGLTNGKTNKPSTN